MAGSLYHLISTPFYKANVSGLYTSLWLPLRMFSPKYFGPNHQCYFDQKISKITMRPHPTAHKSIKACKDQLRKSIHSAFHLFLYIVSPDGVSNCKETLFIYFIVFISIMCCKWRLRHNNWRHWEVSTSATFTVWLTYCKSRSTMNTNWLSLFLEQNRELKHTCIPNMLYVFERFH